MHKLIIVILLLIFTLSQDNLRINASPQQVERITLGSTEQAAGSPLVEDILPEVLQIAKSVFQEHNASAGKHSQLGDLKQVNEQLVDGVIYIFVFENKSTNISHEIKVHIKAWLTGKERIQSVTISEKP